MITDLGIWTIVINLIALTLAVQYSRSETFRESLLYWLIWEMPGLRFVWEKIRPPSDLEKKAIGYRPPATIAVWVFGLFSLYVAAYGLASQRYENAVDKIENRMNAFITQLAVVTNPKVRGEAFGEIREIQHMRCPVNPVLLKPSTVFLSLVKTDRYDEVVTVLTRTVEKYKDNLESANFWEADLRGADFKVANLKDANFWGANLEGANFWGANLEGAFLERANLKDANLQFANLVDANLQFANLEGANLFRAKLKGVTFRGADLSGASLSEAKLEKVYQLTYNQLCSTGNFYYASIDRHLWEGVMNNCPEKWE